MKRSGTAVASSFVAAFPFLAFGFVPVFVFLLPLAAAFESFSVLPAVVEFSFALLVVASAVALVFAFLLLPVDVSSQQLHEPLPLVAFESFSVPPAAEFSYALLAVFGFSFVLLAVVEFSFVLLVVVVSFSVLPAAVEFSSVLLAVFGFSFVLLAVVEFSFAPLAAFSFLLVAVEVSYSPLVL